MSNRILMPALGFIGMEIVVVVVRLAVEAPGLIVPIELVWLMVVIGLAVFGAPVWYAKYRADQKWIRENQDLIEGNRSWRPLVERQNP